MSKAVRSTKKVYKNVLLYLEQKDGEGMMRLNTVGHTLQLSEQGMVAEVSCPMEAGLNPSVVLALGPEFVEAKTRLTGQEQVGANCYRVSLQLDGRSKKARSKIAAFVQAS